MRTLLFTVAGACLLASCTESEKETHGNLQADPNFDGSQDKLLPGSRHPGRAADEAKAEAEKK